MPEKAIADFHNVGHFLESDLIQQICLRGNEAWRFRWNCLTQEHVTLSLMRKTKSLVLFYPGFQSQFAFFAGNWQKWGAILLIHNRRQHVTCYTISPQCSKWWTQWGWTKEVTFRYIIIMKIIGLGSVEQDYTKDPFLLWNTIFQIWQELQNKMNAFLEESRFFWSSILDSLPLQLMGRVLALRNTGRTERGLGCYWN